MMMMNLVLGASQKLACALHARRPQGQAKRVCCLLKELQAFLLTRAARCPADPRQTIFISERAILAI
jgi:hypothetical protein